MLHNSVTFYVPSTKNVGQKLSRKEQNALVQLVADKLAGWFGGATATKGQGFYKANDGQLIVETVTLVKSYHECAVEQALALVEDLARTIKEQYGQESIAIETTNGIEFI